MMVVDGLYLCVGMVYLYEFWYKLGFYLMLVVGEVINGVVLLWWDVYSSLGLWLEV